MYHTHNVHASRPGTVLVTSFDQIEQASLTDVGVKRSHNQDNFAVQLAGDAERWQQTGHLCLVADGMGGHAVGEKASEQAVRIIPHTFSKHSAEGPPHALRKAFQEANATIHAFGEQNHEFKGTGTTSTALVLRPEGAWIGHVGDSRVYRIRAGCIEQLTYDHSYVWEYAKLKNIDPSEVHDFPANVIHRCLGPQAFVEIDIEGPYPVEDGDIFLLCSDGLSGQVQPPELGAVVSVLPPVEACRFLIDLANLRGGPDNITALVVRVGQAPSDAVLSAPALPPRRPRPLLERVPWPYFALMVGSILAALAITLKVMLGDIDTLAVMLFVLAVVPIVAGIAGLIVHQRRQQNAPDEEHYQARVHQQKSCVIDRVLVDQLSRAVQTLRQRADEKQWETDLPSFEGHHRQAQQHLRENDLPGAFRELCRAMRPLTEALHRHRNKEEVFQPVWDKAKSDPV